MTQTTMTYGDYNFSPVPLINIQRNNIQKSNRIDPIGYTFTMSIQGMLTPLPSGTTSLPTLDDMMEDLRRGFNRDGKLLEIKCGLTTVMQIYPRIKSVSFNESNNNWVQTIPYTIEIEYDKDEINEHPTGSTPAFIEDYTEEWNVEFIQDRKYFTWDLSGLTNKQSGQEYANNDGNNYYEARVNHTVTAKGKQSWSGTGPTGTPVHGANNAMAWLTGVFSGFGYDAYTWGHALSGWSNLIGNDYVACDHFRTHVINESEGSATLTENWVIINNPSGWKISEEFTVNVRKGLEDSKIYISIDGSIQGYEDRSYSTNNMATNTTTPAYDNANDAWGVIQDRIFPRAQYVFQQDFNTKLNPTPTNKTIGHQPSRGIITYNYEFNDRPCSFINGSLSENFTIVDNNPTDVFAKLVVLGRGQGPILQEISTVTEATREITVELVMPQPTSCVNIAALDRYNPSSGVETLLCQFEAQLTGVYDQVFKHADQENWNPLSGRYTRTVGWTYTDCDTSPDTSFC